MNFDERLAQSVTELYSKFRLGVAFVLTKVARSPGFQIRILMDKVTADLGILQHFTLDCRFCLSLFLWFTLKKEEAKKQKQKREKKIPFRIF